LNALCKQFGYELFVNFPNKKLDYTVIKLFINFPNKKLDYTVIKLFILSEDSPNGYEAHITSTIWRFVFE